METLQSNKKVFDFGEQVVYSSICKITIRMPCVSYTLLVSSHIISI